MCFYAPKIMRKKKRDIVFDNFDQYKIRVKLHFRDGQVLIKDLNYVDLDHRDKILGFICDMAKWKQENFQSELCMDDCLTQLNELCNYHK